MGLGKCALKASVALFGLGLIVAPASAAVLYDSEGFETPPFINNQNLVNQDPVDGPWLTDNNVSVATVQSAVKLTGNQAVQVDRAGAANADQRWFVSKPIVPSLRYVIVEWDQRTLQTSQPGVTFGPLFGVEAYDAVGTSFPLAGAAFTDSSTGDLVYQAAGSGNVTDTGTIIPFNQWNHFALQLDYTNKTYQIFLNGAQVISSGMVDSPILGFSDAPIAAVRGSNAGSDPVATGTAYFDNYIINTSAVPVPEPTSLAVLGIAVLGLLRRSR